MFYISRLLFLVLVLLSPCFLSASELERDKLKDTIETCLSFLYSKNNTDLSFEKKQSEVRVILENNYDLNVIIRRAIGRNWRLISESEQSEVLELVKQLVIRGFIQTLEGNSRPVVTFGNVVVITDSRIEIESNINLGEQFYSLLYRLGRMRSGWQIYDIVAENSISVVSNYRQQIDDHFRKSNGAELIIRLNELLKQDTIDKDIQL